MASQIQFEDHSPPVEGRVGGRKAFGSCPSIVPERYGQRDDALARSLSELIETDIIPRLMLAHSEQSATRATTGPASIVFAREVEEFAPLVMQVEADALLDQVEAMLVRGVSFETVLVDLLAPTARLLGEFWEADRFDFVEVTMGLWRLQEVVHEISVRRPAVRQLGESRRALFAPMPGDQHSLGTVMVDDIFRHAGWSTDRLCEPSEAELLDRVARDWFDIIGLTVSCDCHIARLSALIAAVRQNSRNSGICVMVGGRIFSADPDLAVRVGADGTAPDARCAPKVAAELIREREWGAAS